MQNKDAQASSSVVRAATHAKQRGKWLNRGREEGGKEGDGRCSGRVGGLTSSSARLLMIRAVWSQSISSRSAVRTKRCHPDGLPCCRSISTDHLPCAWNYPFQESSAGSVEGLRRRQGGQVRSRPDLLSLQGFNVPPRLFGTEQERQVPPSSETKDLHRRPARRSRPEDLASPKCVTRASRLLRHRHVLERTLPSSDLQVVVTFRCANEEAPLGHVCLTPESQLTKIAKQITPGLVIFPASRAAKVTPHHSGASPVEFSI
ncbi:hypothetical protein CSOJ01_05641 [Colletotrichum sojae]|uniref:Uncharacterized protein n=1 Tax=Colletotrichum sojae TaxID=2175907 RepID=A0A8H6JF35_9PEZI|nr:hypothetical protein CSOJ01_05641 [Colletotrichum sojae]